MCGGIGGFKGSVSLFDFTTERIKWIVSSAHSKIVNAIDGCSIGSAELVSGSGDGSVKVWDPRVSDPVITIDAAQENMDCWAVSYGNCIDQGDRVVVAGYDNGSLHLIDLRTTKVRWETKMRKGVCHVSFDRKDIPMNKLAVVCLEGELAVYDMRTYNNESGFAGLAIPVSKSTLWGCHFLPQDRETMAVTSGSGEMFLYRYSYPPQRSMRDDKGHEVGIVGSLECIGKSDVASSRPLISFDWNKGKKGLFITATLDQVLTAGICSNI